ncbi:MAG: glycosyltransferase [Coriobacteriia bacterium]|nr:glycosyltransferase [Coriobacteriia bacterium]
MRVTMINKYYPPHLGGIEFHLRDLSEALAAHDDMSVRAIVANEDEERLEETVGGVEVVRLPRWRECSSTPIVRGMTAELRAEAAGELAPDGGRPDLFHLHFPYPWGEFSWLQARTGVPTVVTYHSDIVRQKVALEFYKPYLRRMLQKVDLVIASSPNMVEHSPFLAEVSHKCRVVPFGIDVEKFAATPEIERRAAELREDHDRSIVLFVGRLIYYKGAEVLVRAMAKVDADLVVIGTGPLESELRGLAAELKVADRVTFLGGQPLDELVAWYHAADVFCLPSIARSEAFGLVQLEAHAAGTPVVSTGLTTGVPFANQHEETGLVVPPDDPRSLAEALRTLVEDESLREQYGARALERVRAAFTIERMVDDTLCVYREALGSAGEVSMP